MYALLDGIQPNERCFEPELDSGLMNEEKRNASLTTRAQDKEERDGESYSPVIDAAFSLSRAHVIK